MIRVYRYLFCILAGLLLSIETGHAQTFDYSPYPRMDFSVDHLSLELRVQTEQQLLEGRASYEITANTDGSDTLILDAAHMDIETVLINGSGVEFQLQNDSLFINLDEPASRGNSYDVEIHYLTAPGFGVHFIDSDEVWTSLLPKSTRHWLPVIDHPRVSFTTDITVTVPGGMSVLAPGRMISEQIISVEEKQVRWQSRQPIPASSLWFVVSSLRKAETSFGVKSVSVSSGGDEQLRQDFLERTYQVLSGLERRLGFEYPFESLHVVLLDDHNWEAKPYGAGLVYIFRNRGSLPAQLARGIYAQWFGVYQREEQWSDAEAMNLYQTMLHSGSAVEELMLDASYDPPSGRNPYAQFGPRHWNSWQQFYAQWEDTTWKEVVAETMETQLAAGPGVRAWDDYADLWYRESGQPWFEAPDLEVPDETAAGDSSGYLVEYFYDDTSGELVLGFEAIGEPSTELITLPLIQYTGSGSDSLQVTFTGERDSVQVTLSPSVRYVDIDASSRENFFLEEIKPPSFLLNRIRSEAPAKIKAKAARQLARHAEDPDLQLAVMDFLSREEHPEIRAALIYALGEITQGSAGTEQLFLNALRNEQPSIQEAGIGALRHFSGGNIQVVQALQNYALNSDSLPLFRRALESFGAVADSSAVQQFTGRVVDADTTGYRAIAALTIFSEWIDHDDLIGNLDLLLSGEYPYGVRSEALGSLIDHDNDPGRWSARYPELIRDSDPRIRLLAVRAAGELNFRGLLTELQERIPEEYDGRVYYEMFRTLEEHE